MPIRLNLLAEAQAAGDARRRDPVKRAMWVAALLIVLILVWSSSLQLKAILVKSEVNRLEGQISSHASEYQVVLANQNKTSEIKHKLDALRRLSATRLLNGTLLNALQQTTVDDVQLLRLRVDQLYTLVEGTKTRTNEAKVVIKGKPPTVTEKTLLTLDGADCSGNPGDQLTKYKDALGVNAYFKEMLVKTNGINLKNLAPPQIIQSIGKRGVVFTLECRYPEVTR
jgi:uncharacterized protein YdbL (DUF1318 family)